MALSWPRTIIPAVWRPKSWSADGNRRRFANVSLSRIFGRWKAFRPGCVDFGDVTRRDWAECFAAPPPGCGSTVVRGNLVSRSDKMKLILLVPLVLGVVGASGCRSLDT